MVKKSSIIAHVKVEDFSSLEEAINYLAEKIKEFWEREGKKPESFKGGEA